MWRVKLYDRNGGWVVTVVVLPFEQLPEVMIWGSRFFQLCDSQYRECSAVRVMTLDQVNAESGRKIDEKTLRDWKA